MTASVALEGLDTVEASVAATVAALQDPELALAAARLVEVQASPLIPRDTGRLAASQQVTVAGAGAALVYAAPYAVFVQASQPWLGAAISKAVPGIVGLYEERVRETWT